MTDQRDIQLEPVPEAVLWAPTEGDIAQCNLWLKGVAGWLRAAGNVAHSRRRFEAWVQQLQQQPEAARALRAWWGRWVAEVELDVVLAEAGVAQRWEFWSELGRRVRARLLPVAPTTTNALVLLPWVFDDPRDTRWLLALPRTALQQLVAMLHGAESPVSAQGWRQVVWRALQRCIVHLAAGAMEPELRMRMSPPAREAALWGDWPRVLHQAQQALQQAPAGQQLTPAALEELRQAIVSARHAAYTAYAHLEEHGVSTVVVFRLRQLRQYSMRAQELLRVLGSPQPARALQHMLARLVAQAHDTRSVRALLAQTSQMLAERVSQRSAETGEHYITRNAAEYRAMLLRAAGGGAVLGLTTWCKFALGSLGLAAFWAGLAAGMNYAFWFVVIMLLHLTVATKQPAMTAPAMVKRLKALHSREAVLRFVDEVAHLVRSQAAAVLGNVLAVVPAVLLLHMASVAWWGQPMIDTAVANEVVAKHQLWGPTLLYAAGTGVLLFVSSQIAGWVENAFVVHRLHDAWMHHPGWIRWLGAARARRWALWLRGHVSGLAANISLGLLLGLVPVVLQFFGLPFDVRHVTLVTGQLTAALASIGPEAWGRLDVWSAVAATLLVGPINVAVSFYLALRLAMRAQNVNAVNRGRIMQALRHRWRRAPWSFVWPPKVVAGAPSERV